MRKGLMIIKDPEVAKLFGDENRRHILFHLRRKEMSTTDLAKALGKNHSSIIHHLNLLKEAELVEETRTEQVRNLNQTFYRATARRFMISYSLGETMNEEGEGVPWQEAMVQSTMDSLEAFGYKILDEDKDLARKLVNGFFLRDQKAYEEIAEMQVRDVGHKQRYGRNTIKLLKMLNLSEDLEFIKILNELRDLVKPLNASEE